MTVHPWSSDDQQLLARTQVLLADYLPRNAVLGHAEVTGTVPETQPGYLYLRFNLPTGTLMEFWAHWGEADQVGERSGQVSVKRDDQTVQPMRIVEGV